MTDDLKSLGGFAILLPFTNIYEDIARNLASKSFAREPAMEPSTQNRQMIEKLFMPVSIGISALALVGLIAVTLYRDSQYSGGLYGPHGLRYVTLTECNADRTTCRSWQELERY